MADEKLIQLLDSIPEETVRGSVCITAYSDDRMRPEDKLWVKRRDNLVVRLARRVMSRLLAGLQGTPPIQVMLGAAGPFITVTSTTELTVRTMKWGTAGHDPMAPATALPVSPFEEDISAPVEISAGVFYKAVSVTYPTERTVMFTATLLTTEPLVQPVNLSEEAIFCGNPPLFMFAKDNYGQTTKNATIALKFDHLIQF